jgi:enoyl-CoA hydratase/carnithine racemase
MSQLLSKRDENIVILTLNRPDKRNALSVELLDAFGKELDAIAADTSIRAVVLTGAGEKAFSAGMDFGALFEALASNATGEKLRRMIRGLQELFLKLEELERPTIAAIEGSCVGGGFEMALACDLRIASSEAQFGLPEVKIGMLPDLGGTTRLARLAGPAVAKEWILTGRNYPAVRALEFGLINELVAPGDALTVAVNLAKQIAANSPRALAWAKRVIDRGFGMSVRESLALEQDAMTELFPGADLREGVAAFMEKRTPKFND